MNTQCQHCGRAIVREDGRWVDSEATGDDEVWRESCESHDTFTAEHEPDTFGWSELCEEDPNEDGRCAYHQAACTLDGPGAPMPPLEAADSR